MSFHSAGPPCCSKCVEGGPEVVKKKPLMQLKGSQFPLACPCTITAEALTNSILLLVQKVITNPSSLIKDLLKARVLYDEPLHHQVENMNHARYKCDIPQTLDDQQVSAVVPHDFSLKVAQNQPPLSLSLPATLTQCGSRPAVIQIETQNSSIYSAKISLPLATPYLMSSVCVMTIIE